MEEPSEGRVTAILPARNEEVNIARAVRSLAAQKGLREILVVDDQSTDRTGEILEALRSEIPLLQVLRLESLPEGWTGKAYAVASAAQLAHADWLLLTDADVVHHAGSLETLVTRAESEGADLLSLSPGQLTPTAWEKAVIPLVYVQLAKRFRFEDVSDPSSPEAAANGQYILIRRQVYERVGGHAAVRGAILEDVELAQRVKSSGGRLLFLPGAQWASTRMYRTFGNLWHGWTKNLHLLYGGGLGRMLKVVAELWLLDVLPVLLILTFFLAEAGGGSGPHTLEVAVAGLLMAVLRHWQYTQALSRLGFERSLAAYRIPGAALVGALILSSAFAYRLGGQVRWKGRLYSTKGKA
jgi:chlorobactene glucosyltransferase